MTNDKPEFVRSGEMLSRSNSRLLIVDVQEKLLPHIPVAEQLIGNCRRLMQGADLLGVPVSGTEQYPKGLGPTTPELAELHDDWPEKLRFSSAEVLDWGFAAEVADDRDQVVVAGIESHVCVQQTVLDLLSHGFRVFVPADAVASRNKHDWKHAIRRMSDSGATVTTTEAILFEWCETAAAAEFKEISRLVTGR
jgi:nicotinamidase-related amidase